MDDNLDKKILKDTIEEIINRTKAFDKSILEDLSLEELMGEISLYHQNLLDKNEELLNKNLELEKTEASYRKLYSSIPISYVVFDKGYRICYANKSFLDLIEYDLEDLYDKKITAFINPINQDDFYLGMKRLSEKNNSIEIPELKLISRNKNITTHFTSNKFKYHDKEYTRCCLIDLTSRIEAERKSKYIEEKHKLIINNIMDITFVFNVNEEKITYISGAAWEIYRVKAAGKDKANPMDYISDDYRESFIKHFRGSIEAFKRDELKSDRQSIEFKALCEGRPIWLEIISKIIYNMDNEIEIVGIIRDINEQKEKEKRLRYLTYRDQLTGVYNRHYFALKANRDMLHAEDSKESLSIITMDLDLFKNVNDNFGHGVGDLVLKEMANIISKTIRKSDNIFRMGGDEFLILMPDTNVSEAEITAKRIKKHLNNNDNKHVGRYTSSFGIAEKIDGEDLDSFLERADDALYEAKKRGGNTIVRA